MAPPARVLPAASVVPEAGAPLAVRTPRMAPLVDPSQPRAAPPGLSGGACAPSSIDSPARVGGGAMGEAPASAGGGCRARIALQPLKGAPVPGGGSCSSSASERQGKAEEIRKALSGEGARKSSVATQEAYRSLARDRCEKALARAAEITKERESRKLPKGAWWGFHYFWPPEKLAMTSTDPMEDPEFLKKVFRLMNNEAIVDTFAIFDEDGSGTIDSKEVRSVPFRSLVSHSRAWRLDRALFIFRSRLPTLLLSLSACDHS